MLAALDKRKVPFTRFSQLLVGAVKVPATVTSSTTLFPTPLFSVSWLSDVEARPFVPEMLRLRLPVKLMLAFVA